jgi:hypothetical protein
VHNLEYNCKNEAGDILETVERQRYTWAKQERSNMTFELVCVKPERRKASQTVTLFLQFVK